MVLDLCHEFHKHLLDTYYGLLGVEDIVIKLYKVKVPALWEVPAIGWKSIFWKEGISIILCCITN